jgi:hypothetical protein
MNERRFKVNAKISAEIQSEQNHGRQKYGRGPDDFQHDDRQCYGVWHDCIDDHLSRARNATPMERRQHLIKIAGLAVSAIESFDRKNGLNQLSPDTPPRADSTAGKEGCKHDAGVYYSYEEANWYCNSCRKGMGRDYYAKNPALKAKQPDTRSLNVINQPAKRGER